MKCKKEWIEVRIWKTRKYPYRATRIRFEMIADRNQYSAVKMLMANLNMGRYSFVKQIEKNETNK